MEEYMAESAAGHLAEANDAWAAQTVPGSVDGDDGDDGRPRLVVLAGSSHGVGPNGLPGRIARRIARRVVGAAPAVTPAVVSGSAGIGGAADVFTIVLRSAELDAAGRAVTPLDEKNQGLRSDGSAWPEMKPGAEVDLVWLTRPEQQR